MTDFVAKVLQKGLVTFAACLGLLPECDTLLTLEDRSKIRKLYYRKKKLKKQSTKGNVEGVDDDEKGDKSAYKLLKLSAKRWK